jgi:chaperonin cofactor prefoldin
LFLICNYIFVKLSQATKDLRIRKELLKNDIESLEKSKDEIRKLVEKEKPKEKGKTK